MRTVYCAALFIVLSVSFSHAQFVDDGIMMRKNNLFSGTIYSYEFWDRYWEGALKRANGNVGTVTTRGVTWFANYGVTDHINVIATVPYVWTRASMGVLRGQGGFQDISLSLKYSFIDRPVGNVGNFRAIAVATGGAPLTSYTPDFMPMSIGPHSKRIGGRFTSYFQSRRGWFLNGSAAYTWRGNVTLDRPYYYTDGQLYLSNEVTMPNIFDYSVSAGYLGHRVMAPFTFTQQRMQSGGDIRRQDMPFLSNRMNFSKIGASVMSPIPFLKQNPLRIQVGFQYTIDGRNVGQSTAISTGVFYTFNFSGVPNP